MLATLCRFSSPDKWDCVSESVCIDFSLNPAFNVNTLAVFRWCGDFRKKEFRNAGNILDYCHA